MRASGKSAPLDETLTSEGTTPDGIWYGVHGDAAAAPIRVVFLQGVAASSDNCRYLIRAISQCASSPGSRCIVTIDNVGIGRSPAPPARKEYSIARMARDVAAVVEAVGWDERPIHLLGHSMGGVGPAWVCFDAR